MNAINEFYYSITKLARTIRILPATTEAFLYDPRFNDLYVLEMIESEPKDCDYVFDEPDRYYRGLMIYVDSLTRDENTMTYICDSSDVDDSFESGDFNYYSGFINDECAILYHQSSHIFAFPSRIVFYAPEFQIEVHSYKRGIDIYEVIPQVRNMFFIKDINERRDAIRTMLYESDRPRLDK